MWLNGKLSIELKKYVEFRLIGKMHPRLRLCMYILSKSKALIWKFFGIFLDLDIRKILGIWWQFCFQLSKIYLTKKYISFQFHEKIDNFRQIAGNIPNAEFSCSTTIKGGKKKTADTLEASFIFCCV